jgi:CheY-like chemotaxis protein
MHFDCTLEIASHGKTALTLGERFERKPQGPDVILLDVALPNIGVPGYFRKPGDLTEYFELAQILRQTLSAGKPS